MSTPLIVPFNNQPVTTSVKTASYTIPAGKYAKVKGYFINDGSGTATTYTLRTLTIDGVAVVWDQSFVITRSNVTVASGGIYFTVPEPFRGSVYWNHYNGNASGAQIGFDASSFLINALSIPGSTRVNTSLQITGGESFYLSNLSGSLTLQYYKLLFKGEGIDYVETWVPSGTVLSGNTASSFHWLVEEYNMIS